MGQGGGASGKGSSAAETNQTVTNQQVATESGIAVGANSNAAINVQTADPEVAKAAISGNSAVNIFTSGVVRDVAGTSILAQNNLATKFSDVLGDVVGQNLQLFGSLGQQQTDIALGSQRLAGDALGSAFGVARAVAPQDANFTSTELAATQGKTMIYLVLGLVGILGLGYFLFRKKAA